MVEEAEERGESVMFNNMLSMVKSIGAEDDDEEGAQD